jgi:hypothetical protein
MPFLRVARPFTLTRHPNVAWRYGVGMFDVNDPEYSQIVSTPALRWHLDVEVLARGEALVQHREPQRGWYAGSVWYRSISVVASIEPREILIWRWPPDVGDPCWFPFHPGHLEAAPGAVVSVLAPHVDGKEGSWRRELRPAAYRALPFGEHYGGHCTPHAVPDHPFALPFAQLGDTIVFGAPSSGTPLKIDTLPRAIPREDPRTRELRERQAAAVERAQRADWSAIVRAMLPAPPLPEESEAFRTLRDAHKPPPARATAVAGFELAEC